MAVTRATLLGQLQDSAIGPGDILLFHSSLKAIGWVEPGPQALIEAMLECLGASGTLAAPTLVPAGRGLRPFFDPLQSPSEMGRLTEIVRTWPGAVRSMHPTHSVAALGARARELCADHPKGHGPVTPWGTDALGYATPWDRLREWNAWILLIGVDFTYCTLLHHAQVRYLDSQRGVTWKNPWPIFSFQQLGRRLQEEGIVRTMKLGQADCLLARAGEIVDTALHLLTTEEQSFFPDGVTRQWLNQRRQILAQRRTQAATFKVDITPLQCERPIARPLHMRGLILEHPQAGRAAHVVWDQILAFPEDSDPIRRAISEAADVPFDRVLLTSTHTHSGFWWPFVPHPEHREMVISRIREPIRSATKQLHAVRAGWRTISAPGIARNRTVFLKDGRAYTERWSMPSTWHVPPETISHRGPEDAELRILVIEQLDGRPLAVAMNFSCHNSAGGGDPGIHDDFFGIAAEIIEQTAGGVCLISPGSIGDQDPTALIELGGQRDLQYANRLGRRLAGYALTALADVTMHDQFELRSDSRIVRIALRESWKPLAECSGSVYQQHRARNGFDSGEVSLLAIGDYAMVGIPGELFTAPAGVLRDASPFSITSVMSLTNGALLYLPDKTACFPGSMIYGACDDLYAMVEPGSDMVLVNEALDLLKLCTSGMATGT